MPLRAGRVSAALAMGGPLVLVGALLLGGHAFAQSDTFVELQRKDTRIVVTLMARSADGARFIGNNRNCEPDVSTSLFYGPEPGYVDTAVDERTHLRSNVAIIRTPVSAPTASSEDDPADVSRETVPTDAAGKREQDDPAEQQTLELYDGSLVIGRPGCIEEEDRATDASVQLVQGRTKVLGTRFFLDRGAETGTMDGPITLAREADGDSPSLEATADSMTLDTQDKHATLHGDVRVMSEDRTTTATTLELDEDAGVAVLTGAPARSVKGNDVLQGERLLYYLDSNDVVVLGNVYGELEFDVDGTEP